MRRTVPLLTLLAALLLAGPAVAHIAYNGSGQFMHQSHSRDLGFYNGVNATAWREETRDAQLDWHGMMNGSLRFHSVSHEASIIHVVDTYYGDTGWCGYAWNWNHHNGHGHAQLNQSCGIADRRYLQKVACHEIGHFTGLAHSDNASDCLKSGPNFTSAQIGPEHRDQLRGAWNSTGH